jgi:hypothetical protein
MALSPNIQVTIVAAKVESVIFSTFKHTTPAKLKHVTGKPKASEEVLAFLRQAASYGGTVAAKRLTAAQRSERARVASVAAAKVRTAKAKKAAAKRKKQPLA